MGEVWLAEHGLLKRPCAVKFIRPDLAASPVTVARFAREVQAVTGLSHVNTVRVFDYGQADDGSFYLVMEYLEGPTLEQLVREAGPLSPGRVVYLLRQVCGVAVAHGAGLVHRDLKPSNVIVATLGGQRDVAKLLDFGLVQDLSTVTDERLTRTGMVLGTPAYMSPEQAAGDSTVDARGDLYSLGAVAFFALTARPPFQGKTIGSSWRPTVASRRRPSTAIRNRTNRCGRAEDPSRWHGERAVLAVRRVLAAGAVRRGRQTGPERGVRRTKRGHDMPRGPGVPDGHHEHRREPGRDDRMGLLAVRQDQGSTTTTTARQPLPARRLPRGATTTTEGDNDYHAAQQPLPEGTTTTTGQQPRPRARRRLPAGTGTPIGRAPSRPPPLQLWSFPELDPQPPQHR